MTKFCSGSKWKIADNSFNAAFIMRFVLNHFLPNKILDMTKLKAFADN